MVIKQRYIRVDSQYNTAGNQQFDHICVTKQQIASALLVGPRLDKSTILCNGIEYNGARARIDEKNQT